MTNEEKLENYYELLDTIRAEIDLDRALIVYDIEELDGLLRERIKCTDNTDFYAALSYGVADYDTKARADLVSLIYRCALNGVEFPHNSNEAINIAAENGWNAVQLMGKISDVREDLDLLIAEQEDLENFKSATMDQIKTLQKKL